MEIAVGQLGISYGDFWQMKPRHFWRLVKAHRQKQDRTGRRAGPMAEDTKNRILAMMAREQERLDALARVKA